MFISGLSHILHDVLSRDGRRNAPVLGLAGIGADSAILSYIIMTLLQASDMFISGLSHILQDVLSRYGIGMFLFLDWPEIGAGSAIPQCLS